jgi:hypothetical protein
VLAIGGLLICVVLLTVAAVARLVRSSNPPRWTTHDGVGQIISLALACTLPLGLACLGAGLIGAVRTGPDYLDLVLLAVVLLVSIVIWLGLSRRIWPRVFETDASGYASITEGGHVHSSGLATVATPVSMPPSEPPIKRCRQQQDGRRVGNNPPVPSRECESFDAVLQAAPRTSGSNDARPRTASSSIRLRAHAAAEACPFSQPSHAQLPPDCLRDVAAVRKLPIRGMRSARLQHGTGRLWHPMNALLNISESLRRMLEVTAQASGWLLVIRAAVTCFDVLARKTVLHG